MKVKNILYRIVTFPIRQVEKKVKETNWYKNSIPDTDNYPGGYWYRDHLERNYDVVNVGSSSAVFCFDYDGLPVKAFNWALKPQSMEYSFKVLKQYFSILGQKGIVIIPFSPFSGLSLTGKWTETANDKYFHILDRTLIDNYPAVARRRFHPLLASPIAAVVRLFHDVPAQNMYSYNIQCKTDEEFKSNALHWIKLWMREFDIVDLNAPLSLSNEAGRKKRMKTVKDMINFCLVRNLRPVIVLPPAHPALNDYFTEEFCRNYIYSFIKGLEMDEVEFLDYLKSPEFSSKTLYRDSFFMNPHGAKLFTARVLTDLKLIQGGSEQKTVNEI